MKTWAKLTLLRAIQVFLGFGNFFQWFIKRFCKIVAPFTSMLQTTNNRKKTNPRETTNTRKKINFRV